MERTNTLNAQPTPASSASEHAHKGLPQSVKRVLQGGLRLARAVGKQGRGLLGVLLRPVRGTRQDRKAGAARRRLATGVEPLSYWWGLDRGRPPYQYYLFQFLEEFKADIRGHCLEFQDDHYTTPFGRAAVTKLDLLHIDDSNPKATLIGDLTRPNNFPSDCFDCIICTHVLHVIYEFDKAVAEMYRMLKPGGVLLVGGPLASMDGAEWGELWRFTSGGLKQMLARAFGEENVTIRAYGNSLTAAGQLRGLTVDEFTPEELDTHDARFAVEVCGRARKPQR